jgi:hypothetical protein
MRYERAHGGKAPGPDGIALAYDRVQRQDPEPEPQEAFIFLGRAR